MFYLITPEWVTAIATSVAVLLSARAYIDTRKNTKITLNLTKTQLLNDLTKQESKLHVNLANKLTYDHLRPYLNFLERLAILWNNKRIDLKSAKEYFGAHIITTWEDDTVKKFISEECRVTKDTYSNLKKLYWILKCQKINQEKMKKNSNQ
jgi:hypothetical protein